MTDPITIAALYHYPVKGLSPQALPEALLTKGDFFPGDRLYAIENGPSGFDFDAPAWQAKIKFLMLMRNERLAQFTSRYDEATHILTINSAGSERASGNLKTEAGRARIETFFAAVFGDTLRGPPKVLEAPNGFRFTDSRKDGFVSLINLASVSDLEGHVEKALHPLRFRANIYLDGAPAWSEQGWIGKKIRIGQTEIKVTKMIDRCAATDVEPYGGARNTDLVGTLQRAYGHNECGVYAKVIVGGRIAPGDTLEWVDA